MAFRLTLNNDVGSHYKTLTLQVTAIDIQHIHVVQNLQGVEVGDGLNQN